MLDERLCKVVGNPHDKVTHWGISRVRGGKAERLDHPASDGDALAGVRVREWPIEQLSLDEVRARWGSGSYKIHWLCPHAEDAQQRSGGHGPLFTLDPEVATHVAAAVTAAPPMPVATPANNGVTADSLLSVVTTMMELSDRRAASTIEAITRLAAPQGAPAPNSAMLDEMSKLRAELAATNARVEADRERRALEERFREDKERMQREAREATEKLQRELDEAKRRADDAERDADRPATIEPGQPIMSQLGYGAANALMQKPELAGALIEKAGPLLSALFGGGGAVPAPPASGPPATGIPAPKAVGAPVVTPPPAARPPVPVKVAAVPPIDPARSSWQPITPPPVEVVDKPAEAPAVEAAG